MVRRLLEKAECASRSKKRKQDFSRDRKTPFKKRTRFMAGMAEESPRNALERFFPKLKEAARMSRRGRSARRGKK
jgi:hypothetical protein